MTNERGLPPHIAYPFMRRVRNALWFIRTMAERGSDALERTQSKRVAETYGLTTAIIKRIKAKYRNELSFSEGK